MFKRTISEYIAHDIVMAEKRPLLGHGTRPRIDAPWRKLCDIGLVILAVACFSAILFIGDAAGF